MKAVCFESVQQVQVNDIPDAILVTPTDAIVQVEMAGLCGSDLHAYFGREKGIDIGTVMGHEFVGHVVEVGSSVESLVVGDRVCAPFTTNCGTCYYCVRGITSRCTRGQLFGWRESGAGLHGGQSEFVRVPLADSTLLKIPAAITSETALLLGDNLSTGYFAADMLDIQRDGIYAVVGCGTVGLLAIQSAHALGAKQIIAVEPDDARRAIAKQLGAVVFRNHDHARAAVDDVTDGRGADGVMELVGLPAAQRAAYDLIRPGGTMSVIGCHCSPNFSFSPVDAYDKNLTYRTGRCPARHYMSKLLAELLNNPIDLSWCITHRFSIERGEQAYSIFANREDGCVKAVLEC